MAMTLLSDHMSLADVKNHLSEVVDRVEREHGRVVITKRGRPAAVVLSIEDLESLEETLQILNDRHTMAGIDESRAEPRGSAVGPLSLNESRALFSPRD